MNSNFELDATQWSALRRLLHTALPMPPAARAAWLDGLQGDHAALKPRLRALLEHGDDDMPSPLDAVPRVETAQILEGVHRARWPQAGETIGPYRLVRHLGEGGMGSVWLGERADGLVRRPVALKFPRVHTDRHGLSERLARERDFLAALDHPDIARLCDAGIGADGRPFIALEYVEGRRIDRYCDEHKLATRARVRLFVQVADAVASRSAEAARDALAEARTALERGAGTPAHAWRDYHRSAAALALLQNDPASALAETDKALALSLSHAHDREASFHVGEDLLLRAEARRAAGDRDGAAADAARAAQHVHDAAGPQHPLIARAGRIASR